MAEEKVPVHAELIRQTAQGEVLHNDDTSMRVLALQRQRQQQQQTGSEGERTGVFTSGIVSIEGGPPKSPAEPFRSPPYVADPMSERLDRSLPSNQKKMAAAERTPERPKQPEDRLFPGVSGTHAPEVD